ncbi:MAG: NAD-dependent epimerase/dehydratase family protein [Candidatus Heimdallarchaeota archaeon]|nr:NAD-dependent epimerase/dehydratase family protein [Candidatus Heimdallarchaeota archaeon]MCG3256131.1 NAD-dependent epimerase/dehydratase family protein [Candidatus Heimdallarchaeota archaeon]MCK4611202.1 NAD-dependent epimerase/dehydratase family protein [Candidatus Heimdallarchaeota archaeon]
MSILITGITGFLGTNLVKEIRKRYPDERISALVLPSEKEKCETLNKYEIELFFGNLDSKESLVGCLDDVESVFHLAAVVDDLAPLPSFYRINHIGTKNLLDEFIRAGSKKFIYMSTLGVYGFKFPDYPIDESFRVDLIPGYRESKYLGEQEVFKFAEEFGFKASALRPPIIFGPGDHWAPTVFNLIESNRKIPFISKGKVIFSYSYVEDVVEALIKMEAVDKARGEIFNHTSFILTRRELFETAAKICKTKLNSFNLNYNIAMLIGFFGELQWKLFKKKPLLDRYRVNQMGKTRIVNTEKIESILGVTSKKTFEEALTETYNWYLKDIKGQ